MQWECSSETISPQSCGIKTELQGSISELCSRGSKVFSRCKESLNYRKRDVFTGPTGCCVRIKLNARIDLDNSCKSFRLWLDPLKTGRGVDQILFARWLVQAITIQQNELYSLHIGIEKLLYSNQARIYQSNRSLVSLVIFNAMEVTCFQLVDKSGSEISPSSRDISRRWFLKIAFKVFRASCTT